MSSPSGALEVALSRLGTGLWVIFAHGAEVARGRGPREFVRRLPDVVEQLRADGHTLAADELQHLYQRFTDETEGGMRQSA
jgi:hypothetical protein